MHKQQERLRLKHPLLLLRTIIHIAAVLACIRNELTIRALLQIIAGLTQLVGTATEEDALAPFPGFDAGEEEDCFHEDDSPLPGDAGVFEDVMVEDLLARGISTAVVG